MIRVILLAILFPGCLQKQPEEKKHRLLHHPEACIALLPYDHFDKTLLPFLSGEITSFYHRKVIILPVAPMPAMAWYAARSRYKADSLLRFQQQFINDSIACVLGCSFNDISTRRGDHADWGVFGLGYHPCNSCVISTFRLSGNASQEQLHERLAKVALHELGHNMGLPHCSYNSTCLMNDAKGTMAQVDAERKELCNHCRRLLAN